MNIIATDCKTHIRLLVDGRVAIPLRSCSRQF